MSKTRDTGFLGNVIKVDTSGNVSFVSGSTTLATINTSGQLSGSSPVLSSSYALNADLLDGLDSTQFTLTSSFAAQTASFTAFTASVNSFTASQLVLNGKYATTGSNTFAGIQTINSNLVVTGSITAQTLVVQTITSSVDFVTGSTRFGSVIGNTHVFTGSVSISGSLSGTSATFTEGYINGATDAFFHVNRSASGNAGRIRFQTAGTTNFQMGLVGGLSGLRMLNSEGTTTFTMLESGETTFINNTNLNDGYYISTRPDNTSALRIGLMMRRGDGTGTYADIMTTGNTSNGAGSIQFGFNSSPKMILTDGGNLTLGDYTPTDTLGAGRVIDVGSSAGGSIVLRDTTNPSTQYGGMSYTGDADNGLRIWSNGFVGFNLSSVRRFTVANNGDITIGSGAAIFFGGSALTYISAGDNSMSFAVNNAVAMNINSSRYVRINGPVTGYDGSSANFQVNGFIRIGGSVILHNSSSPNQEVTIACNGAASLNVAGAFSANSKSFLISHPLANLKSTHNLRYVSVEAPQADLHYRGKLTLVNGKAQANIDEVATMTEGTFEALCREVQCFTTNESGWDLVKGKVIGNIIYIESQNTESTDEISWMVIGERKDKHMMDTSWTDENGKVIVEPLIPEEITTI